MTHSRFASWVAVLALVASARPAGVRAQSDGAGPRSAARVERQVHPGGQGPNRLLLDAWTVAAGRPFAVRPLPGLDLNLPESIAEGGLGDLRLFDRSGREVPYLLVPPPARDAKWTTGAVLPLLQTRTTSGFELALDQATNVNRLRIDGLPAPFLKRATLEGSGDREHWTLLTDQATVFDLPDQRLKQLEIPFATSELRYLRVTWDDRSSGRVPLPDTVVARLTEPGPPREHLIVPLVVERRASESGRSRYRLTFPAPRLPVVAIEIAARDANVLRSTRVVEPQLSGNHLEPRELGSATISRASREDAVADNLTVPIAPPAGRHVDLTIDDGSNTPLDITRIAAVLAPLPWIYFESPDGQPLVARLGDQTLAAPSYDLEAVRPTLSSANPSTAAWGEATPLPTPAGKPTPVAAPFIGGVIDVARYQFARAIPAGPEGLTALSLDAAVLAHSRLADLRIVDETGRQVAYLLESRDEPLSAPLGAPVAGPPPAWIARERLAKGEHRTAYTLRLPHDGLPASRLVLTTSARVFTRPVVVFVEPAPGTPRDRIGAVRVASAVWSHTDPDERAPQLTLDLPALHGRELALLVDEGDNAPLALESATVLLPGYAVRFFRSDSSPLTLYYGDDSVGAPRYDLALLQPYLVDAPATELAPGAERRHATPAPPASLPTWAFWGVLVGAVIVLLALIGRLLRSEGSLAT
jgi:Protein of unknown function (DUF3999)